MNQLSSFEKGMESEDSKKVASITKLGQPLTVYKRIVGVCLNQINEETFLLSLSNAGVNWKEEVNIKDITVGAYIKEASKDNEFFEKEEEGCEGGACKI